MNPTRRLFLTQLSVLAGAGALKRQFGQLAPAAKYVHSSNPYGNGVVIYHTNHLQGKITAVHGDAGGPASAAAIIKSEKIKGLLLDAGGFLNPARSRKTQRAFIYAMNTMGCAAAAVSNQEFAQGSAHLASMIPAMQFTLLNCNHRFNGELAGMIKPYVIIKTGSFKTGVMAVSSPLEGCVYNDAIESAHNTAGLLKNNEKCDLVICLSQLGHNEGRDVINSLTLAEQSEHIDMIIGGGSEVTCAGTHILKNKHGYEVILAQTAPNAPALGRTIINFDGQKQKSEIRSKHFTPAMPQSSGCQQEFAASRETAPMELAV